MNRTITLWLGALLALTSLGAASAAQPNAAAANAAAASRPHPAKPPFPQMQLADPKSGGQRAIDLLGSRLPEVARWYGKSPEEFKEMLLRDRRLKIDKRGRMFVEDELDEPLPAGSAPSGGSSSLSGELLPLEQTFSLHSRPGAKRTIYLNFKGAMLTNTAWNGSTSTITALPFDTDGVPYSFSTSELQRIQYIWQRVTEDYAPFDVDVTTEAPSADLLTRSGSADQIFGTTVLITSRNGVYNCSCGGVAYIGIFDETTDYYKPALVFYDALGNGNEKYVAEAISHEAGHNMGLTHDGYSGGSYYQGQGSGATGWAPIMGVGYYQPLVQWSKGEYATANNVQDDYVVMNANGLPARVDDHGDTIATATALDASTLNGLSSFSASGVIERPGDVDLFKIGSAAGTITVNVAPAARSANLDVLLELRDGNGTLLASANPLNALAASLSYSVAAPGSFYVGVRGTGQGDPLTTGYTNYGSVGQYALSATAPALSGQPPLVAMSATPQSGTVPLAVSFSSTGSSDPDGAIVAYEWSFGDGSGTATSPTASHTYTAAGTYAATLKLTDNSGLTSTKSVTITAEAPVAVLPMGVADVAMSVTAGRNARATAAVTVRDGNGNGVSGATVTGKWSGLVAGNSSGLTGSNGVVQLQSPNTKKYGTFVFTVTGVSAPGYAYDADLNVEASDSITR